MIQFTTRTLKVEVSEPEACPKCGASYAGVNGDPECDSLDGRGERCMGYGPVPAGLLENHDAGLEVAYGATEILLRDVLGYGSEVSLSVGTLDPHDLLRRITVARSSCRATSSARPAGPDEEFVATADYVGMRPTRVIDCGISKERLERYLGRLATIASAAAEAGDPVEFC